MPDFAALKAKTRQVVHDHLAVAAVYRENDAADPVSLTVRWHDKIALSGDVDNGGYTQVIEGVNRLVFNIPQLVDRGLTLRQGGKLRVGSDALGWQTLVLGTKEKAQGPIEEIWQVGQR